jgi:CheY-like chemotaxis protein
MKILIVDDSPSSLKLMERIVATLGHEVATHLGPFGTVSEVSRWRPDVVLLDLEMPGLRGDSLAELISRPLPDGHTPVLVFVSGVEPEALEHASKRTKVRAALRKGGASEMKAQLAKLLAEIARDRALER